MWFPLESYDPTSAPQTGDVLSQQFQRELPGCVGLWLPSIDDRGEATDFNPTPTKNFGSLNSGVTTTGNQAWTFSSAWRNSGTAGITTAALPTAAAAPLTIWAVVIPSSVSSFQSLAYLGDSTNEFGILISSSGQVWANEQAGTSNAKAIGGSIAANAPSFVCGVYESSTSRKIYLNGALVGTDTASLAASSASPRGVLFTRWHQTGQEYSGNILAAGMSLTAFTAAQVSTLYSCLLAGEPFPLFEPTILDRAAPFGAATTITYPARQPIIVPPEPFPFSAFNYL